MKIVVFGASGNIGSRVVDRLLRRGDHVTACVHGTSNLPSHPNLTIISIDIYDKDTVDQAIAGHDAVMSTLGSWGTKRKDILSTGMKHIIPAMEKHAVRRIVSLTGSGVVLPGDTLSWYDHLNPLLLRVVAPKILMDGSKHIALLEQSSLDWTVVRSPVMKDGPAVGYTLQSTPDLPWRRVTRDDVADAIVELVHTGEYSKASPIIA